MRTGQHSPKGEAFNSLSEQEWFLSFDYFDEAYCNYSMTMSMTIFDMV